MFNFFIGVGGIKLLGAPALPVKSSEASGEMVGNAGMLLFKEWNCEKQLTSMVFDTTSANTGEY